MFEELPQTIYKRLCTRLIATI